MTEGGSNLGVMYIYMAPLLFERSKMFEKITKRFVNKAKVVVTEDIKKNLDDNFPLYLGLIGAGLLLLTFVTRGSQPHIVNNYYLFIAK